MAARILWLCCAWLGVASVALATPDGRRAYEVPPIRRYAWQDGTFDLGDGKKVTFAKGKYADLDSDGRCNVCMVIRTVTFGDVDGDGKDEALMIVSSNLGGAGTSIDGFVFDLDGIVPRLRAAIEGGDRGEGGIESVAVHRGLVVVRRFDLGGTDSICCPSRVEIQAWRWSGSGLEKVGPPKLVPRPPAPWFKSQGPGASAHEPPRRRPVPVAK